MGYSLREKGRKKVRGGGGDQYTSLNTYLCVCGDTERERERGKGDTCSEVEKDFFVKKL
jgi:hypothetical protein